MSAKEKTVTRLDSQYMQQYDTYRERQRNKKKRLIRRLVSFSLVVAIAIGSMVVYHFHQRSLQDEANEQYDQLTEKLSSLKDKESNLREEIALLKDEDYVLEIARTNYFFSNKGELIFKVPDEKTSY